jgi:hypothetical protein
MDSQLIRAQFLPHASRLFGRSHVALQFFYALKFFFGDSLTWDDACPEFVERFIIGMAGL